MNRWPVLWAFWMLHSVACAGDSSVASNTSVSAAPLGGQDCEVCGMLVREQPAPRGQVVYRDGTRAFVCSPTDLVQLLAAPSAHGKPARVFVEALAPDLEPSQVTETTPTTWIDAQRAVYVVGLPRRGVMGTPILAYADRSGADRVSARFGGRVLDWNAAQAAVLDAQP